MEMVLDCSQNDWQAGCDATKNNFQIELFNEMQL